LLTGAPAILENASAKVHWGRADAEVRAAIQELLDGEINRSVAGHGGKISIVDYRDGRLRIAMSGGCQGCASSQVTLRQGVEIMVRRIAPEVVEIVDATDHAAGKTPFYAP
jgi:NFU1 iron-sulfur cluster scaffold homolog, mitochondrial